MRGAEPRGVEYAERGSMKFGTARPRKWFPPGWMHCSGPSTLSLLYRRVERLEAGASVGGPEAPAGTDTGSVSTVLPGSDLAERCLAVGNAPVQVPYRASADHGVRLTTGGDAARPFRFREGRAGRPGSGGTAAPVAEALMLRGRETLAGVLRSGRSGARKTAAGCRMRRMSALPGRPAERRRETS